MNLNVRRLLSLIKVSGSIEPEHFDLVDCILICLRNSQQG